MNAKILLMLRLVVLVGLLTACNYPGSRLPGEAATSTPTISQPAVVTATQLPNAGSTPVPATLQPTQASGTETAAKLQGPQAIVFVEQGEVLNVRQGPGTENAVVGTLLPQDTGVSLTGRESVAGEDRWAEVKLSNGTTGWVNVWYLTEAVSPSIFCADPAVGALLDNLKTAITTTNGDLFSSLISPRHGLTLHYFRGGTVVNYSPEEARFVFVSDYVTNWGTQPASGAPVEASFKAEVLPKLQEVLNAPYERTCNDVKAGGASYPTDWPYSYGNINFYSLFKPGSPGVDLDWRTFLAGIEYAGGKPYLFSLVHYFWEP